MSLQSKKQQCIAESRRNYWKNSISFFSALDWFNCLAKLHNAGVVTKWLTSSRMSVHTEVCICLADSEYQSSKACLHLKVFHSVAWLALSHSSEEMQFMRVTCWGSSNPIPGKGLPFDICITKSALGSLLPQPFWSEKDFFFRLVINGNAYHTDKTVKWRPS